jgi:hypothetical protein
MPPERTAPWSEYVCIETTVPALAFIQVGAA